MNETPESSRTTLKLEELFSKLMLIREWRLNSIAHGSEYSETELFVMELIQLSPGISALGLSKILKKPETSLSQILERFEIEMIIKQREKDKRPVSLYMTEHGARVLSVERTHHFGGTCHLLIHDSPFSGPSIAASDLPVVLEATKALLAQEEKIFKEMLGKPPNM
ncbi:MAG: hypothetical protein PHG25_03615 [Candidatus Pacebacteria bacterium]|nr:hypothetical protein [Candidatus Paceibacterota bacterium]